VLVEHAALYADFPAFAEHVNEFADFLRRIHEQSDVRNTLSEGKADARALAKERLVKEVIDLKTRLYACARRKGLVETRALAGRSNHKIPAMKEGELRSYASNLAAEAEKLLPDLSGYRYGQAELDAYRKALADFEDAISDRDTSMAARRAKTSELEDLFHEAYQLLKEGLDTLMNAFRHDAPVFYDTYKAARLIRRRGVRHQAAPENPGTTETPAAPAGE
jgi:hypothetical protein